MSARFNPTHRCGHMGKTMPDTATAHAFAAEAIATVDCWSCTRAEHGVVAAEMMEKLGLPQMIGASEKQEMFARDVRERIRQDMESEGLANDPAADALLYGVTDARWWLDRKDAPAADVIAWIRPVVDVALSARSN